MVEDDSKARDQTTATRIEELERAVEAREDDFSEEQLDAMVEKPEAVARKITGRNKEIDARLVKAIGTHCKRNRGRAAWTYRGPSSWPPRRRKQ